MNISCVLNACGSRVGGYLPESETLALFEPLHKEYRSTERVTRRNKPTRYLGFHRPARVVVEQPQPQPNLSQQTSKSRIGEYHWYVLWI